MKGTLTPAVGEPPETRRTHGTVSTNHVGPAPALTAELLAGVAEGPHLVAGARHGPVVEEGRQGHGRAEAERRRRVRAGQGRQEAQVQRHGPTSHEQTEEWRLTRCRNC